MSRIYNSDGSYIDILPSTFLNAFGAEPVPTNHDCINHYNSNYLYSLTDRNASHPYKYAADGTTIGGEGLNVKYSFVEYNRLIDAFTDPYKISPRKTNVYRSDVLPDLTAIECQDGEVYRIGIKFYNSKGQSSFVKWKLS